MPDTEHKMHYTREGFNNLGGSLTQPRTHKHMLLHWAVLDCFVALCLSVAAEGCVGAQRVESHTAQFREELWFEQQDFREPARLLTSSFETAAGVSTDTG